MHVTPQHYEDVEPLRAHIADLRDMLASIHYEVLAFAGVKSGTALAQAMKRIETEFGADPHFNRRWDA